jgi:iron(III) transport system ATP-binding protein
VSDRSPIQLLPNRPAVSPGPPVALRCRGISKAFDGLPIVREIDLDVARGSFTALLGPSGCGKTTMLRLIAGFERLDAGTVELNDRLIGSPTHHLPPEKRRVGMVFQEGALFGHLDVAANVAFGLPRGADRERLVAEALETVGLTGYGRRMPHQLSGGQQQRVALARALAPQPEILLLDEPFANLDAGLRAQIRVEVRSLLRGLGATAVLVTHDQEEALSLADQVAVMMEGRIVQADSPETLYHRPVSPRVATFVGDAQFVDGEASGRRVRTELGDLPLTRAADGPVRVMIRPEQIRLVPPRPGEPPNAVVEDRLFFGHDQLLRVRLETGGAIQVRLGAYGGIRPGHVIHVAVRGAVTAFPRD